MNTDEDIKEVIDELFKLKEIKELFKKNTEKNRQTRERKQNKRKRWGKKTHAAR